MRATWESRGRPARLVILRDDSLDVVTQGRLTRRTPRRAGPLTLTTLSRYLPRSWLSIDGGTATLSAAVVLTPRVVLDVGGDVTTVKLTGGATLPQASSIYTGSGRLLLHGVTITSADPASGQPLAAGPGRPFLVATSGGRLEASDVTVTDLGTSDDGPRPRPAVQFNAGSTGSVVRSTFTRNSVGLQLDGSQDVRIEDVAVTESLGHGLSTSRDSGTVLRGIRAERNAGDGIRLNTTTTKEPITGVSTAGNGRFGIAAIKLRDTRHRGHAHQRRHRRRAGAEPGRRGHRQRTHRHRRAGRRVRPHRLHEHHARAAGGHRRAARVSPSRRPPATSCCRRRRSTT